MVAVLPAVSLDSEENARFDLWLESGRNGDLKYMERPLDRTDPRVVFPEAGTVVVVALFYSSEQKLEGVARFAQSDDYHQVIRARLHTLLKEISAEYPGIRGRAVVDTAPIFEKAWARRAGFGWVGRNSLIINPQRGSFFNIGILLLDHVFPEEHSGMVADGCANCRKCIDSCPMHAIGDDRMIDARRCISALTIEKIRKGAEPEYVRGWKYGCDECQICCPFNQI